MQSIHISDVSQPREAARCPQRDADAPIQAPHARAATLTALSLFLAIAAAQAADAEPKRLFPTAPGGREWIAKWDAARTVKPYELDPLDALCRNSSDVPLRIAGGIASFAAGTTRLYVITPDGGSVKPWRNVEMTVHVRRGATSRKVEWQAFYLSARSGLRHDDSVPCEGTSYHATARFDGQLGFKKELWHTGGYTQLAPSPTPKPWPTVPEGRWVGMKFICRNFDGDRKVKLQCYLDAELRDDWKLAAEFDDAGGWRGERPGCDRPQDQVLTAAFPAVYFRTDYVAVELKDLSVREIAPLPRAAPKERRHSCRRRRSAPEAHHRWKGGGNDDRPRKEWRCARAKVGDTNVAAP